MLYDKMLSYLMLIYFDINVYLPCVFNIGFTITHLGCEASIRLKICILKYQAKLLNPMLLQNRPWCVFQVEIRLRRPVNKISCRWRSLGTFLKWNGHRLLCSSKEMKLLWLYIFY